MVPLKMVDHAIRNFDGLLSNADDASDRRARMVGLTLLDEAIRSADPRAAIRDNVGLSRNGKTLRVGKKIFRLDKINRIFVVGGGKASGAMADQIEKILGNRISDGCVSILRGTRRMFNTEIVELRESSHPIPDESNIEATERILNIIDKASHQDLILCLFSGGGSSLFSLTAPTITLQDSQELVQLLLRSGATINELNAVRKHISQVSGGRLAESVSSKGCLIVALLVSDVVGDPLDVVAGGPTAPDTTTYGEAVEVLKRYDAWNYISESIKEHLQRGFNGRVSETPKPGSRVFDHVHNFIISSCRHACYAAYRKAKQMKLSSMILSTMVEGEAKEVGKATGGVAKELVKYDSPVRRPAALILGGETTVTVHGQGIGGRNQELVLSASKSIDGLIRASVASIETDGIDGPTDAAGAIVDGHTAMKARMRELDIDEYLARNDSNKFFKDLGDGLIVTGPTGTNVNDVIVVVAL